MKPTLRVFSDQVDHKRDRTVLLLLEHPNGAEQQLKFTVSLAEENVFIDPADYTVPRLGLGKLPFGGNDFLQAILDHAWEQGLRPTGFRDVPRQVAALQDHLADMRALVFAGKIEPKQRA